MNDKHPKDMTIKEIENEISQLRKIQAKDTPYKLPKRNFFQSMTDIIFGLDHNDIIKFKKLKSPEENAKEDAKNLDGDMRRVGRDMRIGMLLYELDEKTKKDKNNKNKDNDRGDNCY